MADAVIDIEALLAPLPAGEGGAGEDLRSDYAPNSPWLALREARANARDEERSQDAAGETEVNPPAAWREVKRIGLAALAGKTRDFEVAAWVAEALVRLDGLPGLVAAARLIEGLADRYWEHGFPQPDEDGLDGRAAPLGGLAGEAADGTIMQPLRRMALFHRPDGTGVGLYLWQAAEETAALADPGRKKARLAAGVPELAALQAEARLDTARLRTAATGALAAGRAWAAMDAKLSERFGAEAPSTRRVSEALQAIVEIAERVVGSVSEEAAAPAEETAPDGAAPEEPGAPGAPAAAGPRPLRTREDAIRQIEELAEWFRKTEPHSPLAFTLTDAVRRARLPLPELLAEVLPDEAARTAMLTALGIRPAPPDGSGGR